ncbi:MAG TPA: hypothetical protein VGI92_10920, partial [Gemmatimonadales bacterium]
AGIFSQASWANAESYYHQAIALNGQNIYHHLELAEALNDQKKKPEAIAELQQAAALPLACDPGDAVYKQHAAELLQQLNR